MRSLPLRAVALLLAGLALPLPAAAQLRQAGAVLVGEPAGDELDFWSEGGNVVLPHSRLTLHYADRFHSYSPVERPELREYLWNSDLSVESMAPDVPVRPRWRDYLAGRDPALEAILSHR